MNAEGDSLTPTETSTIAALKDVITQLNGQVSVSSHILAVS